MTKKDTTEAAIRGLGAEPGPDPDGQLAALRADFEAKRLNGEPVWDEYPDAAAAGFHPDIHPELVRDKQTGQLVPREAAV